MRAEDIFLFCLAVVFGILDLAFLIMFLYLPFQIKKGHQFEKVDWLKEAETIVGLLYGVIFYIPLASGFPPTGKFEQIVAALVFPTWLFELISAILQDKLARNISWKEYGRNIMNLFFTFFLKVRYYLRRWEMRIRKAAGFLFVGLAVLVLVLASLAYYGLLSETFVHDMTVVLGIGIFGTIAISSFLLAMRSCRRLLVFWFTFIVVIVVVQNKLHLSTSLYYLTFVIMLTLFWLLLGGIADYDRARMAATIVNTMTTLVVIVANVLAGWIDNELGPLGLSADFCQQMQYVTNTAVLPFVIAGYLTALLKEMQVYWEDHYPECAASGNTHSVGIRESLFQDKYED